MCILFIDVYSHRHHFIISFMPHFCARNHNHFRLCGKKLFWINWSPIFDKRRAYVIPANSFSNSTPHIFTKGKAIFTRTFIAKFYIDFRFR